MSEDPREIALQMAWSVANHGGTLRLDEDEWMAVLSLVPEGLAKLPAGWPDKGSEWVRVQRTNTGIGCPPQWRPRYLIYTEDHERLGALTENRPPSPKSE